MVLICKNHPGQNFKYKLEESFWFRVTETKQYVFKNLLKKIYYFPAWLIAMFLL